MNNDRREFIKKTSALAVLSIAGVPLTGMGISDNDQSGEKKSKRDSGIKKPGYIPDAGIKMCFAYFAGIEAEKRKIEFGKQLNVLGAVGGINPRIAGLNNVNAWDYEAVAAVKNAWDKEGLKLEVIEAPLRPDHITTMAGDSNERPGYSALGSLYAAGYIRGLIEAIARNG